MTGLCAVSRQAGAEDVKGVRVLESLSVGGVKMQRTLEGVRIALERQCCYASIPDQSLKAEEQKIGFTDITLQGGGAPAWV